MTENKINISARIDSYYPNDPNNPAVVGVVKGEGSTTISVTFTNTGNTAWKFIAEASVWDSNRNIVVRYEKTLISPLQPGQQTTVPWNHTVNKEGGYQLQFTIWKNKPYTPENFLDKEPSPSQKLIVGEVPSKVVKKKTKAVPKISGLENRVLHTIKKSEDSKIRQYRRRGYSRRVLRAIGKMGMKDFEIQRVISSQLLVRPKYAESIFQSLYDKKFFDKSKLHFYSLSPNALTALALVLRRRGLWGPAVIKILRRDLTSRGMTKELRKELGVHQPSRRTRVIPPIIGHF